MPCRQLMGGGPVSGNRAPGGSCLRERGDPPQDSPLKWRRAARHCTATTIYRILVVGPSARRIPGEVLNFGNTWNVSLKIFSGSRWRGSATGVTGLRDAPLLGQPIGCTKTLLKFSLIAIYLRVSTTDPTDNQRRGMRKVAVQFGVATGTVQRIARQIAAA